MRKKLVAGNWKMNTLREEARALLEAVVSASREFLSTEVVVCPPFPYLETAAALTRGTAVEVGAQNAHFEESGAFTGEVAPPMLRDLGCAYVILGHSERRALFGETDQTINRKIRKSLAFGLLPIFCVGETLEQRKGGSAFEVLNGQVVYGLEGVDDGHLEGLVIAYEPVWAIGTGVSAAAEQAEEAHRFIRDVVGRFSSPRAASAVRIIYGGSVTPQNAAGLMGQPDIDGALVGGASLKADGFCGIIRAAEQAAG